MEKIITKELLDLYDKYEGDWGLLDERWASEKDREKISIEQLKILSEYVDLLHFVNVQYLSEDSKSQTVKRISDLEEYIEEEVANILKERIKS